MAAQQENTGVGVQQPGGPGGGTVVGATGNAQPAPATQPPQTQGGPLLGNQFGPPAPPGMGNNANSAPPINTGMFNTPINDVTYTAPTVNERTVEGPQIDYGQYDAFTREMTDEELTSKQLQGLLESDSPYMRQAALAGQRMAAQRGALSSSISAGASQASAIQAALPIASADAQAYQKMATENAAAINTMNVAKLESVTNMATSKLNSLTQLATTAMDAETQSNVAALNANFQSRIESDKARRQRENIQFEAAFNQSQELLRQSGALELEGARGQNALTLQAMQQAGMIDLEGVRQQGAMEQIASERQGRLDEIGARGTVESVLNNQDFQNEMVIRDMEGIDNIIMSIGMSGLEGTQLVAALNAAFGIRDQVFGGGDGGG